MRGVSRTEHIKITKRRIEKAERDECVDIGMTLTPPKTYMGGFTRPRDLRVLAWSKGGAYERRKVYEDPSPDAYVPHTVYFLEGRYLNGGGIGTSPSYKHIIGFCRESEFPDVLKRLNSDRTSKEFVEAMDTAQWPWVEKRGKRVKWWKEGEDPKAILQEIYGNDVQIRLYDDASAVFQENTEAIPGPSVIRPSSPTSSQQIRGFHTSARTLQPTSYNEDHIVPDFYVRHKQGRARQASGSTPSTTSPGSTSTAGTGVEAAEQKAHDPARQKAGIKGRKHEESALMQHLSDSILSDEIAASTRRLKTKIPVEHYDAEGNLTRHSSGFVVPGNGHSSTSNVARAKERERDEDEDRAAQTAAVAERVLESDFDHVHAAMASTRPRSFKVPFEVREPDGTVKHPSGFVPPTPANEFKYSDSASLDRDLSTAIGRQRAREASASRAKNGRGLHTTATWRASEVYPPFPSLGLTPPPPFAKTTSTIESAPASMASHPIRTASSAPAEFEDLEEHEGKNPKEKSDNLTRTEIRKLNPLPDPSSIRAEYLPTLSETPFFRPLLTLTFSTRPMAYAVSRLAKALPRGLSYVAAVDAEDRKHGVSFSTRVRNMRLARMQGLTVELAQLLAGARGGLMGARFRPEERGRGVDGEGFGKPVDYEKRVIGVGVGNWYSRAGEVKDAFRQDGEERVRKRWIGEGMEGVDGQGQGGDTFKVYGLDDFGKRIDDVSGEGIPYPERPKEMFPTTWQLAEKKMENLEVSRTKVKEVILEAREM
ncbi:hypothetical protein HYDPIDRAFT_107937 [Hydnomerulius pinastri MD-312]|nr:hypothetical protein HYDPIDRAFT_107937 [Hydnomerulius pinastri MD-312]